MADLIATADAAAPGRALIPSPASGGAGAILSRVRAFTAQPAVAKSLPMVGLIALLGVAALAWFLFSQPPQRDLFRGLADADKAAVAESLTGAGIKYTIDRATGTLTVADDDFYRAKMMLAQAGLPKSAPDGDAMISSLPLGASRAVEGERLRGAREMDLARTIEQIDAVQKARVHLAMEQPSVFLRDRSQPAASVMLTLMGGRSLSDAQVAAMQHLVASSVPGLAPDAVSIVDQTGQLLSRDGGDPASDASERQIAIQAKMEARYQEGLRKLLTPLLGEGNFTAEVHADLDFAEVQATRESYPKDATAVRAETGGWTKTGGPDGPGAVGGIPGALSNQAPPAAQVAAAPNGTTTPTAPGAPAATGEAAKTTEQYNRTFELGREVSVTKNPVGTVRRLSVAVALKDPAKGKRTPAELAQLEALIKGAVGFDQQRGDVVALSARKFADVAPEDAGKWWDKPWVGLLARNLSALLIAALLVFGIGRPLLKRRAAAATARVEAAAEARAAIGKDMASAITDQAREGGAVTLEMIEAAPGYTARAELIRNFVRQDPARAALVVRDLIRADARQGDA
ncbi:flagellar basal-body MS-ring/collar protein FliF [Sphingomonas profundi]|uniref:flagellar basal-body MS-ring/collar protein FliF n=1 Tax=Alterirhizorhabdus profundi TaxID=2681549 RepID=UPI0012E95F60|nr:flagellar basal-body MS-ring/collar protein FliF [Sphingomonas profundi]